jgi:hypothetical protein
MTHTAIQSRRCAFRLSAVLRLCLLLLISVSADAVALPRMLPPEAIAFSEFQRKSEFDQRFPGQPVSDIAMVPQGWYVRYQHEALVYLFGPIRFASTAEDYATSLRRIVSAAVAQRAELASHTIEVVILPEPVATDTDSVEPTPEPRRDTEAGSGGSPPPPPQPWWQRLLGIFRRGG